MFTEQEARQFAEQWVAAWNAHDLEAILAHYADDIKFVSPFVASLRGEPTGTVRGKAALRSYFQQALAAYPDLRFELLRVLVVVQGVKLLYRSVNSLLAAETMQFNPDGKVASVLVLYAQG